MTMNEKITSKKCVNLKNKCEVKYGKNKQKNDTMWFK
jgi:hypothetical protein